MSGVNRVERVRKPVTDEYVAYLRDIGASDSLVEFTRRSVVPRYTEEERGKSFLRGYWFGVGSAVAVLLVIVTRLVTS